MRTKAALIERRGFVVPFWDSDNLKWAGDIVYNAGGLSVWRLGLLLLIKLYTQFVVG